MNFFDFEKYYEYYHFPNIDPVLISFGWFQLRYYSLAYILGLVIGFFLIKKYASHRKFWQSKKMPIITNKGFDDLLTYITFGVIFGGRIGYCLFYEPDLFFEFEQPFYDPLAVSGISLILNYIYIPKFVMIWNGGMSFHGAFTGVVIATILYSKKYKVNILTIGDLLALVAPIGLFFGRIANFINAELYGRPTDHPIGMVFPTDPLQLSRHPSQLYEALLEGLVIFLILQILMRFFKLLNYPGIIMGTFLILYATFRSYIENFREPDIQLPEFPFGLTMGMMLSFPMFIMGVSFISYSIYLNVKKNKK